VLENSKVIWKEGMFLQPQHLQQSERSVRNSVHAAQTAHSPYWYGITALEIDKDAVANGLFAVTRCSGMLPDGVTFSIPGEDPPPAARSFADHLGHDLQSLDVFLALPVVADGKASVVPAATEGQASARFRSRAIPVADEVLGTQRKEIEVGALNFTVLFGDESLDNHAALQVGRLVRNKSGTVELSESFVPPLLCIAASSFLLSLFRSLLELLLAKINSLSQGRKQVAGGFAQFTGSDETPFRLLTTLNRSTPMLTHYHSFPGVAPFEVFSHLSSFAGELCTFSSEVSIANLPRYDHANLSATFSNLVKIIRAVLEADIQAGCVPVPIEQINQATFLCKIPDEKLLTVAKFYLGVSAKVQDKELVVGALQRIKMCSRNRLDLLISSAMPGLPLKHAMHPPQGLSTKPGFVYFSLEQQGDFWNQIKAAGNIAFYFPNSYPELKMEMLALKE
jgi:type VI secretion system protein ImpJ